MSAFRASFPVTSTSFINRCGSIGLNLLPMLLVERALSAGDAAVVMGSVRVCALLGVLLGGWVGDRLGLRAALLWSFALAGVGMAPIPWVGSMALITVLAGLSQLGNAMYTGAARLMLTQLVPAHQQQEAIAWQRTSVNLGQIVSYSIGAAASGYGMMALFLFDAVTSFLAAGLGARTLPRLHHRTRAQSAPETPDPDASWPVFMVYGAVMAGFVFLFEMFMVGASARCAVVFGADGVQMFSLVMVVNTVLCTLLSVVASRVLTREGFTLPLGILLVALGASLVLSPEATRPLFFAGTFILTLGEIVFAAVGPYVLVRVTPAGENRSTTYSCALLVQMLGKVAGGAAAFPWLVHGEHPRLFLWACALAFMALSLVGRRLRHP